jgi:hypothetical protein
MDATLPRFFVEGKDDEHFLYHWMKVHVSDQTISVKEMTGFDNLLKDLEIPFKSESLTFGFVVDADVSAPARWDSLRSKLIGIGIKPIDLPQELPRSGFIGKYNEKRFGIFVMPDNLNEGMLETFASHCIAPGDELWSLAVDAVGQIPQELRRFKPVHTIKAEVHTWLAWQETCGVPLGQAVTRRFFEKTEYSEALTQWMKDLIGFDSEMLFPR